jgi:superfamily II DNA or RNA helicase
VDFIETDFTYDQGTDEDGEKEMLNVQQMYRAMRENFDRNNIVLDVIENYAGVNDYCLVLGDSLEHLRMMSEFVIYTLGRNAAFICGETPKHEREQVMKWMREGQYQYLFATYQLAKLGLDIPRLNKLILASPHRDKTSIQQAVGRIMRPFEGKPQPVVYDIYDSKVPQLVHWARERVRVYRSLGCQVNGGPKVRKW